jgi:hypothetical protein
MERKWVRIVVAVALTALFGFGVTLIGVGIKQLRERDRNQATQKRLEQLERQIDQMQARANGGRPSVAPGAER